jgi:hypothetical protein
MDTSDVSKGIQGLLPSIRKRREEIEKARRMPRDLVDGLRQTGVFALAVPQDIGGAQASPLEIMRAIESVATAENPAASGFYPTCNGSSDPTDPTAGECTTQSGTGFAVGDAKRIFRGIEMVARKQFTNQLWAQASFLYSSLRGNYSGAIREASGQTDPGINADYDYYQFTFNSYGNLELDRPVQARVDAVYNAPFGLSAGLGFYVRSGLPISRLGWFNDAYSDLLYLNTRGSDGRTPTDYDLNLSLAYNANIGPVTVTPQLYLFNVLNRQTATSLDSDFNFNGSIVTDTTSPFYGQPGVEPGQGSCSASASSPCTDNPDYRKAATRNDPRLLRVALKITF